MAYPTYEPDEVDSKKTTEWFPVSQNPTLPGYYQFAYGMHRQLSGYFWYWDGKEWFYDDNKHSRPYHLKETFWRGLKTPPK